jgi:hypothetical protein
MLTEPAKNELIRIVSDRVRTALSTEEGRADFEHWYEATNGVPYKRKEEDNNVPHRND